MHFTLVTLISCGVFNDDATMANDFCCFFSSLKGFIWTEIKQMWDSGFQDYIDDWWNLMDFIMNSLYLATISLKVVAYMKVLYMLVAAYLIATYSKIF